MHRVLPRQRCGCKMCPQTLQKMLMFLDLSHRVPVANRTQRGTNLKWARDQQEVRHAVILMHVATQVGLSVAYPLLRGCALRISEGCADSRQHELSCQTVNEHWSMSLRGLCTACHHRALTHSPDRVFSAAGYGARDCRMSQQVHGGVGRSEPEGLV